MSLQQAIKASLMRWLSFGGCCSSNTTAKGINSDPPSEDMKEVEVGMKMNRGIRIRRRKPKTPPVSSGRGGQIHFS